MTTTSDKRLQVLAEFVRTKRTSDSLLDQEEVTAASGRRRTPGLRREELGQRAGLSADWIARIEQARDVRLSVSAARRLAVALCLTADETRYLLDLVGSNEPTSQVHFAMPAALPAIVAAQGANPAYVTDREGFLVLWNGAAGIVFDEFGRDQGGSPNILRYWFLDPRAQRFEEWSHHAQRMIAHARLRQGSLGENEVIAELRASTPEFDRLWKAQDVMQRSSGRKTIHHPDLGIVHFDYCSFQAGDSGLSMTLMAVAQESSNEKVLSALLAHPERGQGRSAEGFDAQPPSAS